MKPIEILCVLTQTSRFSGTQNWSMNLKFALRTLTLLPVWFILQNFNLSGEITVIRGKSTDSPHSLISNPASYKIRKIVLDAGHGGKDPGCLGAISKEKDHALDIVLKVGRRIKDAFPDIQVIYTRETDVFVDLKERAAIANRNNADLFISVHCNSIRVSHVNGTETYVMGLHTAAHNLEVAKRENASIYLEDDYEKNYEGYDPNSPEAHIIGSVWQSAYLEQSILFASLVQQQAKSTALREDRGVKQAGFLVLRETAMPAVLIETGYLTNRPEEEFIASEEGRMQMAQAIYEAFEAYKNKMEGFASDDAPQKVGKPTPAVTTVAQNKPAARMPANNQPKSVQTSKSIEKQDIKAPSIQSKIPVTPGRNNTTEKPARSVAEKGPFSIFLLSWPIKMDRNAGQLGLIGDIKEEKKDGQYHYYTGHFNNRTEAEKMLPEIRNLGFKTAVIVPVAGK